MCRIVEPHATYKGERLGDDDLCGVDGLGRLGDERKEWRDWYFYDVCMWCCRNV